PAYDGNIREKDLRTDTPYNTYTRNGLPPTPIALPSREAIEAVTHPQETGDIFFVATGARDGSHVFSATLEEHNAAVARYLARQVHIDNLIRPALTRGEWVLCDRFTDATHAYQGGGRGVDRTLIDRIAHAVHGDLMPDCTLLLDVPVRVGLERMQARRGAVDRFEIESAQFFERVRNRYLELARASPQPFRVIDATANHDQVCDSALAALDGCLELQAATRQSQ